MDNLIHLSGASSKLSSLLTLFYGSDMAKVDLGGGGVHYALLRRAR